jgi:hypothetical protein
MARSHRDIQTGHPSPSIRRANPPLGNKGRIAHKLNLAGSGCRPRDLAPPGSNRRSYNRTNPARTINFVKFKTKDK